MTKRTTSTLETALKKIFVSTRFQSPIISTEIKPMRQELLQILTIKKEDGGGGERALSRDFYAAET